MFPRRQLPGRNSLGQMASSNSPRSSHCCRIYSVFLLAFYQIHHVVGLDVYVFPIRKSSHWSSIRRIDRAFIISNDVRCVMENIQVLHRFPQPHHSRTSVGQCSILRFLGTQQDVLLSFAVCIHTGMTILKSYLFATLAVLFIRRLHFESTYTLSRLSSPSSSFIYLSNVPFKYRKTSFVATI